MRFTDHRSESDMEKEMAPMCRIDITAGLLRVRWPAKYFVLADGGGSCFAVTECSARILRRQSTLLLSCLACAESTEYATSHAIIRCAYPCRYRLREMQDTSTFP